MKKRDKKHEKRIKKLIVGVFLCATLLIVSTYAWFIGMKTVNVSSFDVTIAGIDGLSLSLNGEDWNDEVTINKDNYNDTDNGVVYTGHTNSWGGKGLIPMSTVGKIDKTVSRMILYEKGSLTATAGGYRLMSSKVRNGGAAAGENDGEVDGYVAFDLFIKNLSGNEYYGELTNKNEEAIYLTRESSVEVGAAGAANTGIENSVRVGFAQIGRVQATEDDVATITGITCTDTAKVKGICEDRDAQIWEPNDKAHVQNAINWYNASCKKRTGSEVRDDASYSGTCNVIKDGEFYQTYAVSGEVDYADNIDVYDGEAYNSYTGSVADAAAKGKLVAYDTFTDTEKLLEGVNRPELFTLAPNSITKVRVYIWIEGQDIDNYDFASLGKQIKVQFGFTKERFYGEDINYDDTNTATLPQDVIRDKA